MSIASRITAIEEHLGNIYDTLELGGSEQTDKNIVNIDTEIKTQYKDFLANGTDTLWDNWDKTTQSNVEEATLNNTIKARMDIDAKGQTSQITYTGKNLFNKQDILSGYELTFIDGGNRPNDLWFISAYIPIQGNTTYYISGEKTSGNSNCFYDENKIFISSERGITNFSITSPSNAKYLRINGLLSELDNNIMVEQGAQYTSYEPYVGGTASPNPDYPQTINNVSGDVEIEVGNKNLFTGDFSQFDSQGGTGTTYAYFKLPDDNKTYTLTAIAKNDYISPGSVFLGLTGNGGDANSGYTWVLQSNTSVITKGTIISKTSTSQLRYVSLYSANANTLNYIKDNFDIILEEGSTATSYVPHQSQTVTFPLSSGQKMMNGDYLADDGIHHVRGQVILKGTENWILQNVGVGQFSASIQNVSNRNVPFCNTFKCKMSYEATDKPYMRAANNQIFAELGTEFLNSVSVAEWKSYLANKYANNTPVIIETSLDQEVIEPYTSAQQTAYNQIKALKSYNDQTNIYQEAEDLPFKLDITALQELS